jgi:hypothetical protein
MNRFILGLAVLTLLVNGLGKANADVIFNDYGPLYTYQTTIGWTVSGSSTTFPFTAANEFTASLTAAVTAVDLGISLAAGTNSVVVELMTDNGGTPGSVLESYGFVDQMGAFGSQNSPLVATSVTNPILVAGTNYWMVAVPGASDTNAAWNYNDQSVTGTDLYSRDGGATWTSNGSQTLGAFEVFGAPVPVPSTLVMSSIIFGMGGLVWGYKRFKQPTVAAATGCSWPAGQPRQFGDGWLFSFARSSLPLDFPYFWTYQTSSRLLRTLLRGV